MPTHDSWQDADSARHVIRDLGADLRETLLLIEGVRCTACVWLIERSLGAVPGVVSVQVNAVARRARVIWQRHRRSRCRNCCRRSSRTGYRALPLDAGGLDDLRRRESRDALKRLLVAGFGAMQAMMYATAIYLGAAESLDDSTRDLLRWLGLLVATPVVLYSARPFFTGALRSLAARRVGMDVPVALAICRRVCRQPHRSRAGRGEVYFDSVSMFVFFLLTGRYLEMRARHHARDLTDALARLTPPFAERALARRNAQARRHPRAARGRSRARGGRRHRAGRRRAADRALPRRRSAAQRRVAPGDEAPRRPADRRQRARGWSGTAARRARRCGHGAGGNRALSSAARMRERPRLQVAASSPRAASSRVC